MGMLPSGTARKVVLFSKVNKDQLSVCQNESLWLDECLFHEVSQCASGGVTSILTNQNQLYLKPNVTAGEGANETLQTDEAAAINNNNTSRPQDVLSRLK